MDAKKEIIISEDDTKQMIRTKVWNYLESSKLGASPWPPHKRIPNYINSQETADRARELDLFKSASVIKIDPDKPLQFARFNALEDEKTLLVPVPRLSSYFMSKIESSEDSKRNWSCSSRGGLLRHSSQIKLEEKENVDLIVVGAVAVSPKGWRIGKGMGFSDLEYAMMSVLGFIDEKVKIVALVHDCQVIEDMPEEIFEQHDVPVDLIVTPTRVIECSGVGKPRPAGIFWNMLTTAQLASIPALRKLRYMEWKSGKAIECLKDETEAPNELEDVDLASVKMERTKTPSARNPRKMTDKFRSPRRRFINGSRDGEEGGTRGRRFGYNRRNKASHDGGGDAVEEVNERNRSGEAADIPKRTNINERRERRTRTFSGQGDSWLYVGNIPWDIRVSEFKQQVREVIQMQPLKVVWKGLHGFAFLSFSKASEAKEALEKLDGMKIMNRQLKVEVAQNRERRVSNAGDVQTKVDVADASKTLEKLSISE